jgi:hypothetical protein
MGEIGVPDSLHQRASRRVDYQKFWSTGDGIHGALHVDLPGWSFDELEVVDEESTGDPAKAAVVDGGKIGKRSDY